MTNPVKYWQHVGVNKSMVMWYIFVKVQHTLANTFLLMLEDSAVIPITNHWHVLEVVNIFVYTGVYTIVVYATVGHIPGVIKSHKESIFEI